MPIVTCENPFCNETIALTDTQLKRHKRHFCNKDCYHQWRKCNPEILRAETSGISSQLKKIKYLAELRREWQKEGGEETPL